MPIEKRSGTENETAGARNRRSRYGYNRCAANGSHGQCYIGSSFYNTYCEWHSYAIQERRTPHLGLEAFAEWLAREIYEKGDRRWLLQTTQEWWDGLSGVEAPPPPACDTCGTILVQGSTLVDFPDDRGKFCDNCWPGPLYPPLAREAAFLEKQRAAVDGKKGPPRGASDRSGMVRVGDVATQHAPPPPPAPDDVPF